MHGRRFRPHGLRPLASSTLVLPAVAILMVTFVAAACSSQQASGHPGLRIVASTNVYADIADQIAGPVASVTAIIDDPTADPHSYQASARDQLALARADLVIENGGGYDDFVDEMLRTGNHRQRVVLNAVALSGKKAPPGGDLNEHVWFDLPSMVVLAEHIVASLTALDPSGAPGLRSRGAAFIDKVRALEGVEAQIAQQFGGTGVSITEPLPLYLLQGCRLRNLTPPEFSADVEADSDVAPRLLRQTLGLYGSHAVRLLVYNAQTSGPVTTAVIRAAADAHIPAVAVTETLPARTPYLPWMTSILATIRSELNS